MITRWPAHDFLKNEYLELESKISKNTKFVPALISKQLQGGVHASWRGSGFDKEWCLSGCNIIILFEKGQTKLDIGIGFPFELNVTLDVTFTWSAKEKNEVLEGG